MPIRVRRHDKSMIRPKSLMLRELLQAFQVSQRRVVPIGDQGPASYPGHIVKLRRRLRSFDRAIAGRVRYNNGDKRGRCGPMQRKPRTARQPRLVPPSLQPILGETEAALRGIYGDRFRGLVLFGSHARGRAVPGSDIDLVLLLERSDGSRERRQYAKTVAELSLRHDTVISLVPMGIEEFRSATTPFLLNVRREGIPL